MELGWRKYQDQMVQGYTLGKLLTETRETAAFLAATKPDAPLVIVRLVQGGAAQGLLGAWRQARSLSHPYLIRMLDAGDCGLNGAPMAFSVWERPDDSVSEVLVERPLDAEEVRSVADAVASALAYLHGEGYVHGSLSAAQIVAVGDRVKLLNDGVRPKTEAGADADLRQFAVTIRQLFAGPGAAPDQLPEPFDRIERGLLAEREPRWSVDRVLRTLRGQPEPADQEAAAPVRIPWKAVAAMAGALGVLALVWTLRPASRTAVTEPSAQAIPRPAPVSRPEPPLVERARTADPPQVVRQPSPIVKEPRQESAAGGGWAVVAAIYKEYGAAEKNAKRLKDRRPSLDPTVFPPKGEGRRYLVLVGTGLSRSDAERLRQQALAAGYPGDTYVTRVDTAR